MRKIYTTHLTVFCCLQVQLFSSYAAIAGNQDAHVSNSSKTRLQKMAESAYPRTHFEKGLYFKQKQKSNLALVEFLKATQENPRLVKAFYQQALIFREKGYLKLATSALEQALAIKPTFQKARVLLATIRLEQGNVGSAAKELSRSLGLDGPEMASASPAKREEENTGTSPPPPVMQMVHRSLPERVPQTSSQARPEKPSFNTSLSGIPGFSQSLPGSATANSFVSNFPAGNPQQESGLTTARNKQSKKSSTGSTPKARKKTGKSKGWLKRMFSVRKTRKKLSQAKKKKFLTLKSRSTPDRIKVRNKAQSNTLFKKSMPVLPPDGTRIAMVLKQPTSASPPAGQSEASASEFFSTPSLSRSENRLLAMAASGDLPDESNVASAAVRLLPADDNSDAWTRRMQYLVKNGTRSLQTGEAFMFSEESGEGVLFLKSGRVLRRQIAAPRDASEIMQIRRPDIKPPSALRYQLSLLGRLLPKKPGIAQQAPPPAQPPPAFSIDELLGEEAGFWGWLKGLFRF